MALPPVLWSSGALLLNYLWADPHLVSEAIAGAYPCQINPSSLT
jgi:hypothetical protein